MTGDRCPECGAEIRSVAIRGDEPAVAGPCGCQFPAGLLDAVAARGVRA